MFAFSKALPGPHIQQMPCLIMYERLTENNGEMLIIHALQLADICEAQSLQYNVFANLYER